MDGESLPREARKDLVEFVLAQSRRGYSITEVCSDVEISTRRFRAWRQQLRTDVQVHRGGGWNRITPTERERIIEVARRYRRCRHRRVRYILERQGFYFSADTVYRVMKQADLVEPWDPIKKPKRPEPAKICLWEPFRPNQVWGWDWTYVRVDSIFHFLIILLDYYSRLIVGWSLVERVTSFEIRLLIGMAFAEQGLLDRPPERRPLLVSDQGAPNKSHSTAHFLKELLKVKHRLAAVNRPTGNARTERVMGTLRDLELNLQWTYATFDEARESVGPTIQDYNQRRPNMGNGGFTPSLVHRHGRKKLMMQRELLKQKAQERRYRSWATKKNRS